MTSIQLHLLASHFPVIGSLLGGLVLTHGIGVKSVQTNIAGYYILLLTAIAAITAFISGINTYQIAENSFHFSANLINSHQNWANLALFSFVVLGLVTGISLYHVYNKTALSNRLALFTLFITIISLVLVAQTTFLGVKINHKEFKQVQAIK